ncbi:hypothetical protein JCM15548_13362 [Geofilum rubicundum JCM 15548]|uniref:Outer membrane efflux protein n=2 Tax=Geofilum TaxID=1236988 RepID=A0A0E9M1K0_9BACT|nr:hypothetical protein JCM15548_13362 [Geofilum rubicundum JCM 15548]
MRLLILLILSRGFISLTDAQEILSLKNALEIARMESPEIQKARLNLTQNRELLIARRASLKSSFRLSLTPFQYHNNRQYNETLSEWYNYESMSSYGSFTVQQPIVLTDGTISLTNRLTYQDSESTSSFSGPPTSVFNNQLSLRLNQPIFTYNRTKLELKELEYNLENAEINYALQDLSLERSVSSAFYQVYEAQMALNTSREDFENRSESLNIVQNKVDAGLVAREELFQAEVDWMTSRSNYQDREVELANLKDRFKQLLGLDLEQDLQVKAEVNVNPVQVDLNDALDRASGNRLELRQRQIDIETGRFDMIRTNATNEFYGNIGVDVGLFGQDEELVNVFDQPTGNQTIGFSLEIPLWDWGEKKARKRAVEAAQHIREINLEDERIRIALSVRQLHRNLNNLLTQIEIAGKNLENAELTYAINLEKYKNGDLTSMDLNLYQNQLTGKKTDLIRARISYKLELLNLKIQTLYDYEASVSVVPEMQYY